MTSEHEWQCVAGYDEIENGTVMGYRHDGRTYAIFKADDGRCYATDGLCTHEKVDLTSGYVFENTIECPKHGGIFDFTDGSALGAPVCVDLATYEVRVEDGRIYVRL